MKPTQNTRVVSGRRRGGSVLARARGKAAAVTRESGEVEACSLAQERKRR